ncbi:MAG: mannose-1-phosphate guanylyltransferase/mannose-6-phosphate isomerase [Burkholderiaceae bacterium]|nr:mannose-1-phosphate guanylyltransferase/mannose-6-phosphate isomerase [Burkholderiaceae bacterium]
MLIPVVLSGGAGTRLWPVSREAFPKPFMKLGGASSLLQRTLDRALPLADGGRAAIVTNREYFFKTREEVDGCPGARGVRVTQLLEPVGRNTAPAVALARQAAELAAAGSIVLFGIRPSVPETGFGYIEMGDALGGEARAVRRFVEKPDAALAVQFLADGGFVWNSGMFCFRAQTILDAMQVHAPELLASARAAWEASRADASDEKLPIAEQPFVACPEISIDYAVMEKADDVVVLPAAFHWSDIGSWKAVAEELQPDADGNTTVGEALLQDAKNTHVQSEDRLVAAVGVENLLIVDTPDALLVADKDASQQVRAIVERLKSSGHEAARLHRTVARPWGTYTVLQEGPRFKIKRIEVKPKERLSLQMHHHRSEHWIVVSGTAKVQCDERVHLVAANESTYIPIGTRHRLENPGVVPLVMIEVQCGDYLGEDDIVRFDDAYGRPTGG